MKLGRALRHTFARCDVPLAASYAKHQRGFLINVRTRILGWSNDQRGITGLETAIILIAFVVVASVFAYTVITAGIYSSQKANEAVNAAIEEVRSSIRTTGNVLAYRADVDVDRAAATTVDRVRAVSKVRLELRVAINGVPIDVTPPFQISETDGSLESSGLTNTLVVDYLGETVLLENVAWTVEFSGGNDGDFSLEASERAMLTVWLVEYDYDTTAGLYYRLGASTDDPFMDDASMLLMKHTRFSLEISPVRGTPFQLGRVTPQSLNTIMNLH